MPERDPAVDLSVVVPAYNEGQRLPATLRAMAAYLLTTPLNTELIVVDDGSSDDTAAVAETFEAGDLNLKLIRHPENRGKGAAVRTGVLASSGDVVLFSDADMSTPIADVERLLALINSGTPVAIGSRAAERRRLVEVHQPLHRELMGRIFNLMVQAVLLPGIWDTQCGFKAFKGDAAREIFTATESDGFEFDVEVLYRAKRKGLKMREVAVHWRDDPNSRVHPLRDSARMFAGLIRIMRHVG
jgi:dolichyl-phosphate beta-glucosyltransferase